MSIYLTKQELAVIEESVMANLTRTREEFTNVSTAVAAMGTSELTAELSQFYGVKLRQQEICLHNIRTLKQSYFDKKTADNVVLIVADAFVQDKN